MITVQKSKEILFKSMLQTILNLPHCIACIRCRNTEEMCTNHSGHRLYKSSGEEQLRIYKDIGKYPNFKTKIFLVFLY